MMIDIFFYFVNIFEEFSVESYHKKCVNNDHTFCSNVPGPEACLPCTLILNNFLGMVYIKKKQIHVRLSGMF